MPKMPANPIANTDAFTLMIKDRLGLKFVKEYRFHPTRRWAIDYACIEFNIALEVEGGVWSNGRHTRGKGFINDMEKYNELTCHGWRLIRVMPSTLMSESTIFFIKKACMFKILN